MITGEKVNAEFAFHSVAERYAATLVRHRGRLPARTRHGHARRHHARPEQSAGQQAEVDLRHLAEPCIIISHDLTPSNTAQMDRTKVLGFRDRHRQQDFPYRHHGPFPAHSRGGRLENRQRGTRKRPVRVARRVQRDRHHQSHRPDPVRVRPAHPQAGHARREAARHPLQAGRDSGRAADFSFGEHRAGRATRKAVHRERRGRGRAVPHGIPLHQPRRTAQRGGAIPGLSHRS